MEGCPATLLGAVAALAALVAGAQASPARMATSVSCGQTLTKSTTLANDLVDCPANGLVVGANDITINLSGHTVDGTGARNSNGISNEKYSHVTIENGTVSDFYYSAVGAGGGTGNVYRKLKIRRIGAGCKQGDICAGVELINAKSSVITGVAISNRVHAFQTNGVDVFNAPGTRITGSRIGPDDGDGIAVFQSPRTRVMRNVVVGNHNGMDVNNNSNSVAVVANSAHGNGIAGIAVGALRGARVVGNRVYANGDDGLFLFDLQRTLVQGNHATRNYTGVHLYGGLGGVAQFGGKKGARQNRLVGNTATKNRYAGIWAKGDTRKFLVANNLLSGNTANRNGRAGGIVVGGSAVANRLRGNTANGNAGHGISAERGTLDGGHNHARGNHRSPQCVGVKCSTASGAR